MPTAYYCMLFLVIAYGLETLFNDIRGETSACTQDDVPKTDRGVRLVHSCIGEYTCLPDTGFQSYIFNILSYS